MNDLKFVAISDDGKMIILQTPEGAWIEVPFDSTLVATNHPKAVEGVEFAKLTPREIQARIRAGATAESLAEASGNSVERINAFAPPILMERQHVALKAARTIVRRASGAGPLIDIISARLNPMGVDPTELKWDSFKREDGRWTVTLDYPSKDGQRTATWLFDVRNVALVPADDEARWLVGENRVPSAAPADPNVQLTVPHLAVVPPVIEDIVEDVHEEDIAEEIKESFDQSADETDQHLSDEEVELDAVTRMVTPPDTLFTDGESQPRRTPSWDDILFGKGPEN